MIFRGVNLYFVIKGEWGWNCLKIMKFFYFLLCLLCVFCCNVLYFFYVFYYMGFVFGDEWGYFFWRKEGGVYG